MSQRIHGLTTGAANRKPSEAPLGAEGDHGARPATTSGRGSRGSRKAPSESPIQEPVPAVHGRPGEGHAALDPEAIARVLRVMADEVERDPALARRVAAATTQVESAPRGARPAVAESLTETTLGGRSGSATVGTKPFRARIITGAAADLGTGIPDPFELRARLGVEGLRAALEDLRLGTLRAMVREYRLDGAGRAPQHNDAARLRQLILEASDARR